VEKYARARQATDGNIIRRMRFACWITKATNIHSEYIILTVFPQRQCLRIRASMLRLYIHCQSVPVSLLKTIRNERIQDSLTQAKHNNILTKTKLFMYTPSYICISRSYINALMT
jgi:hypothetical protein